MIIRGSALHIPLKDNSVDQVVCSPPYFGARRYSGLPDLIWGGAEDCDHDFAIEHYYTERTAAASSSEAFSEPGQANADRVKAGRWRDDSTCRKCGAWRGQLGLERELTMYVDHLVEIFREARRILRPEGALWLNVGDAMTSGNRATYRSSASNNRGHLVQNDMPRPPTPAGLKSKDLIGLPWMVAVALRNDGWWLRSEITVCKTCPMPEGRLDRPTQATEKVFLLAKSARYYYDAAAIAERAEDGGTRNKRNWWVINPAANGWAVCRDCRHVSDRWPKCAWCQNRPWDAWPEELQERFNECPKCRGQQRCPLCKGTNVTGHHAAFSQALVEPMIKAGCPPGGIVCDIFAGTCSTAVAAQRLGRRYVMVELSRDYIAIGQKRLAQRALF